MTESALKVIVLTGSDRPEVLEAWKHLLPELERNSGIEVVGAFPRNKVID